MIDKYFVFRLGHSVHHKVWRIECEEDWNTWTKRWRLSDPDLRRGWEDMLDQRYNTVRSLEVMGRSMKGPAGPNTGQGPSQEYQTIVTTVDLYWVKLGLLCHVFQVPMILMCSLFRWGETIIKSFKIFLVPLEIFSNLQWWCATLAPIYSTF